MQNSFRLPQHRHLNLLRHTNPRLRQGARLRRRPLQKTVHLLVSQRRRTLSCSFLFLALSGRLAFSRNSRNLVFLLAARLRCFVSRGGGCRRLRLAQILHDQRNSAVRCIRRRAALARSDESSSFRSCRRRRRVSSRCALPSPMYWTAFQALQPVSIKSAIVAVTKSAPRRQGTAHQKDQVWREKARSPGRSETALRGQCIFGSAGLSQFVPGFWFAEAASRFWRGVLQGLLEDYVLLLPFFRL